LTEQGLDVMNRILRHNVRTAVNVIDGHATLLEDEESDEADHRSATQSIKEWTTVLTKISEQTTDIRNLLRSFEAEPPASTSEGFRLVGSAK